MVGGFSFYERAEIKDMIGYLKLVQNPDDSIAFMRVVNTPTRGIGKTTMETLERIALETGSSLWNAMSRRSKARCCRRGALTALKGFRDIIEGGSRSSMLDGDVPSEWTGESRAKSRASLSISEERSEPVGDSRHGDSTAEVLKFLHRSHRLHQALEEEDTPDALARIENLRELVNAAMDSRDRGETLQEFLDHAALVSDVDQYDARIAGHADDAAFGQRTGVPAGVAGRAWKRDCFRIRARSSIRTRSKKSGACATWA